MDIKDNIQIIIDDNKLYAYLLYRGAPNDTIHEEIIYSLLRNSNIKFGVQKEKILEILKQIKKSNESFLKIKEIIVKGIPPEESRDGSYKLLISLEPKIPMTEDGKIDHKNIEYYKIVNPNEEIILLYPPYKGKNGINVLGEEIPSKDPKPIPIKTGEFIELIKQDDGSLLGKSKIYGVVKIDGKTIEIQPDLIIEEDASIEKGNLKFNNNIIIKGNVLRGLEIKCGKDLIVEGNIESGQLRVLGNIKSKGINTGNTGIIICNKNIETTFIENTKILCEGNLVIQSSIINSEITSHESIYLTNNKSKIIGGKIIFFNKLECGILGNASQIQTEIYIGYHFHNQQILNTLLEEFRKLEKEITSLSDELLHYKNLINNKHQFSESTKKSILLKINNFQKLKTIYLKKKNHIQYLKEQVYNNNASIQIHNTIYPGVVFHFKGKKFPIEKKIDNPKITIDFKDYNLIFS